MKIAQLNTHDNGGAGKAASRLNHGLNQIGIESRLFVKHKSVNSDSVIKIASPEIDNNIFNELANKYFFNNIKEGNTISSIMYPSVGFNFLEVLKSFDVINLHWVSTFISLEAIMKIRSMGKPIVWTLHDQNPFTGGCHYSHGCEGFKKDCNRCPQLVNNEFNITKHILQAKINNLPKDITIVSPSKWLAESARESSLLKDYRIEVIPNSIETELFKPRDKKNIRHRLDFKANTKVILFGAQEIKESRKGVRYLLEAARYMKQNQYIQALLSKDELCILVFGNPSPILDELNLPYKALGYLHDQTELSEVYSAADVVVLPSIEDNLPNIMLESLSCGTPLVAFKTGGIEETIINGFTGYLCEVGDALSLSDNIVSVLTNNDSFRENCRQYALKHFSQEIQANKYKELYSDILDNSLPIYHLGHIPLVAPEVAYPLINFICDVSIDTQNQINRLKNEINLLNEQSMQKDVANQREQESMKGEINSLIMERNLLREEKDELVKIMNTTKLELEKYFAEKVVLNQKIETLTQERNQISEEKDELVKVISNVKLELESKSVVFSQEIESLRREIESLSRERDNLWNEWSSIRNSKSWKLTKPLRFAWRLTKKFLKFWLPYAVVRLYQKKKIK